MGYARHRTDGTSRDVINALRDLGASVFDASQVGFGFPDFVVGFRGETYLVEVKTCALGYKLTPKQKDFIRRWNGSPVDILTNVEDVEKWARNK